MSKLIKEKEVWKYKLNQPVAKLTETETLIRDFIDRYNIFDKKTDCQDKEELEKEVEDIEKEQKKTESELDEAEKEIEQLEGEEN